MNDRSFETIDEVYHELCDFPRPLNTLSKKDPFMVWESGRMNYWRHVIHADKPLDDPFFKENVHILRRDTGDIAGFCISEYGRNDLFIEVLPECYHIFPFIFRWIDSTWALSRTAVEIDVFSGDKEKINRLEKNGYAFICHFENKWTYNMNEIDLNDTLDEGFSIQAFSISHDVSGRVALVKSAFDDPNYTKNHLTSMMASPNYVDAYNLSVLAPSTREVAYCIGWPDRANKHIGYIEPVGTHPAYRRRGFAKAVVRSCFKRMRANGIRTVLIASDAEPSDVTFLYQSLFPESKREVYKYGKKVLSGKISGNDRSGL